MLLLIPAPAYRLGFGVRVCSLEYSWKSTVVFQNKQLARVFPERQKQSVGLKTSCPFFSPCAKWIVALRKTIEQWTLKKIIKNLLTLMGKGTLQRMNTCEVFKMQFFRVFLFKQGGFLLFENNMQNLTFYIMVIRNGTLKSRLN